MSSNMVADEPLRALEDDDLRALVRIRQFEELLLELFSAGHLHGTTHTCLGQEYVPVALSKLLGERDFVLSSHRGHGHFLSLFGDVRGLLAEITGRKGAVCSGVGGSQHVHVRNRFLSTGIQGENVQVATGVALHFKRRRRGAIALVYIGDGTWGAGGLYEALNMAQLWRVPLVVVVENNGIAQSSPTAIQMAGTIEGRVRGFGMRYLGVSGTDLARIRREVGPEIERTRSGEGPLVLEFKTIRLGPHSKGDDDRPPDEKARVARADWHARYALAHPEQLERITAEVQAEITAARDDVLAAPLSEWSR